MSKYIIENWSAVSPAIPDPTTIVVDAKGMAECVAAACLEPKMVIKVFEVGECIFDSSVSLAQP